MKKQCRNILKCMYKAAHRINVSKHVAEHLVGENHTNSHRRMAGFMITVFGVSLARLCHHIEFTAIEITGDIVGYGIHSIGWLPFLKPFEKSSQNQITSTQIQTNETH